MKHSIRINGQVQQFDCEPGSGIKDKNGVEIFEDDKVIVELPDKAKTTCAVLLSDCTFWLIPKAKNKKASIAALPYSSESLEVVGHIAQDYRARAVVIHFPASRRPYAFL